jgi:FlaG protein
MSDIRDPLIAPTSPVSRPAPVQPVHRDLPTSAPADQTRAATPTAVVAVTGGSLRPAYAQFVVDPNTHDTVLRIRDATTNAVISESPSAEIQAMSRALKAYADTLARHQAAVHLQPIL